MSRDAGLEPIVHRYPLSCPVERAFEAYVHRIGEWWHPDYTLDALAFTGIVIEPRVGGAIRATFTDRDDDVWGHVTAWDPPHRVVHSFTLAQSADAPSEVSIAFEPDCAGCTMTFAHGGWNPANQAYRQKFTEWPIILDRFVALLAEGGERGSAAGR